MSDIIGASERAGLEAQSGTEKPLSDQERALVQRLLSDPFAFPQQFKTWLVSFLEGSDILLPRSNVQGLSILLGSGGGQGVFGLLPAGLIFPYGGVAAPQGAFLCNGAGYSTTAYKRLFDAIGYAFGGSGSTFNVPDLRRRIPWGTGTGVAIASHDNRAEANRHIDHHHFFQDTKGVSIGGGGAHSHSVTVAQASYKSIQTGQQFFTDAAVQSVGSLGTSGVGDHGHSGSVTVSGDTSGAYDNNRPAFLVVNFIINY